MFKSKYYLPLEAIAKSRQIEEDIKSFAYDRDFDVYENAIILPLKRYKDTKLNNGEPVIYGGVFDEELKVLAGYALYEKSTCMGELEYMRPYKADEMEHSDETVIFSGDLNNHFGHFLTDSMTRMWYAVANKEKDYKIALLLNPFWEWKEWVFEDSYHLRMLELLGIEKHRILIIDKPTRFKSVIVPKQSVYWEGNSYNAELLKVVYDKARNSVTPKNAKKVYLSRTKYKHRQLLNEWYFEDFFSARGFKVLHTQDLPLFEQIAYLAGADEIACTIGTLSHLVLFAKPGTKLISLLRAHISVLDTRTIDRQFLIDRVKQTDSTYIDASFNFLPYNHYSRVYLLGPTAQWRDFLHNEYGIDNQSDIFDTIDQFDLKLGTYFKFYLQNLGSQHFIKMTLGFTFSPYPYLKSFYNSLDPNGSDSIERAIKITDSPLFREKLFIYIRPDKNIKCMVKLLADGSIWTVDADPLEDEKLWSYHKERMYFLNADLTSVAEFVIEEAESKKTHPRYKGVLRSKITDTCSLKNVQPGALRNWIIKNSIKYMVNGKRFKKLKRDPNRFFMDSKNPFFRFLGRYYIRGNSTVIFHGRREFKEYFDTHDMAHKVANLKDGMDEDSISYVDNFMKLSRYWYKSTHVGSQRPVHEQLKHKAYWDFMKTFEQPFPEILRIDPYFFFDNYGLADLPEETLARIDGKVIIDGGAYNGDTALVFHHHFPNSEIHAYEPLEHYINIINKFLKEDNCNYKIKPVNKGLGDKITRQFMRFGAVANMADITNIDSEYNDTVQKIGLIKLDVEGMEAQIIKGAEAVIARDKPVLAISIYHSPEDFFGLKDKIKALNPAYRFMIRKSEPSVPQADLVLIAY